jgi:flagellar basal-body rod protein FlgG
MPVLGQHGQIKLTGKEWTVEPNGDIHSDGAVIDKLKIETAPGVQADSQTTISTGSIEGSNVNVVEEMVSMITGLRSYEACQKTIQSIDQTMDKVINQIKI